MILAEEFFKSIPLGYKEKILPKLYEFECELLKNENQIRGLRAGYWVRRIKNTDVFKFRLNNSDRILFTFIKKREGNEEHNILFLKYVNHDEQIRVGNNIETKNVDTINVDINKENYNDSDIIEKDIENDVNKRFKNGTVNINQIKAIVVKDNDIGILTDDSNNDYLYYLSDEQYEVFKNLDADVLLEGAGGTGKTVVLINALDIANKENKKAIYVSKNQLLVDSIKSLYNKFISKEENDSVQFYTIGDLEKYLCNVNNKDIITTQMITDWVKNNRKQYKDLKNRDLYEIVSEINGIIKGYLGLEYSEIIDNNDKKVTMLSLDKYLKIPKQYSNFDENEKNSIYKLTLVYEKWLKNNNFLDENNLARKVIGSKLTEKWDWIIIDEVQDLSEVQIYMLSKLVNEQGRIIWTGDINQTINPTFFNYSRLKNLYYTHKETLKEIMLTKNYRTTKEIIKLINDISSLRRRVIGTSSYDVVETAIRSGRETGILKFDEKNIKSMFDAVKDRHYVAIVVANEEQKDILIAKYPEIEARLFAVNEIKGLEYENVICYNVLSSYTNIWIDILNGKYKRNNNMKYYFNLLYVAMSRAKNSLFIYEENIDKIPFTPFEVCKEILQFNSKELEMVDKSSKADWKSEADRLEKIGQTQKAKFIRDYKLEDTIQNINKKADIIYSTMYSNVSKEVNIEEEIDTYLKPGIIEYRKRNYGEALKYFNNVTEKFPNNAKGYYYTANAYSYMSGGMEYSIKFFEKAIELDPNQYEYYLDMSVILKQIKKYARALEILDIAEKKFPYLGNAKEMKAGVYLDIGKLQKALNLYQCSTKYPKYKFDTFNKEWNKPQIDDKYIEKFYKETKKEEKQLENISKKEDLENVELPNGIEFIDLKENGVIEQCINGIKFKSIKFNKKNKEFYIGIDLEKCTVCKDFNKCIASSCDSKKKILLNQNVIRKLKSEREKNKIHNNSDNLKDAKNQNYNNNLSNEIMNEVKNMLREELNKLMANVLNNNLKVESNDEVEEILVDIFNVANKQMYGSLRDYVEYRIENASDIKLSVKYFRYFKDRILRKIEKYFIDNNFPIQNNKFLLEFSNLACEARWEYSNTDYKYIKKFKGKSYKYQLAYYEVYCNGFIRNGFAILFNGSNEKYINKLKKFKIETLMGSLDKVLDKFTIEKLKVSFGEDIKKL